MSSDERSGHLAPRNRGARLHVVAAQRIGIRPSITVITGERADQWEVRQAAAAKEVLLWHYRQRHPIGRPLRGAVEVERPAA